MQLLFSQDYLHKSQARYHLNRANSYIHQNYVAMAEKVFTQKMPFDSHTHNIPPCFKKFLIGFLIPF